jgi:hypothetical protein
MPISVLALLLPASVAGTGHLTCRSAFELHQAANSHIQTEKPAR